MNILRTSALTLSALLVLSGCGGSDTGADVESNAPPTLEEDVNYNGPTPRTSDVVAFKINVWDNLVSNDRCGACHDAGGQSPAFVHDEDINIAYNAANTIVDLRDPGGSYMVERVADGHNCWLEDDSACATLITTWIDNWAGQSLEGEGGSVDFTEPPIKNPGETRSFPASSPEFSNNVYPLLDNFCSECHRSGAEEPIAPYFGSPDVNEAYQAAQGVINLDNPSASRLVTRLGEDFHNCWSGDCADDAQAMSDAIATMTAAIQPAVPSEDLVLSKALNLDDGIIAATGGRVDNNVVAKYEFRTGSGTTAYDTSGVEPALDLTLTEDVEWVGGWGIQLPGGTAKAQGSTADSSKLHDTLTGSGEFSIEAWVVPATPSQEDANIVSYSAGMDNRNTTLSQQESRYNFALRHDNTSADGMPALESEDESLQATLQHVVLTYDATNGRRIYINGVDTGVVDAATPSLLNSWNDTYALVLGNEASGDRPWSGTLRMVAIHNRALNPTQIQRNFDAGVGERFYLLFSIAELIDQDDAYIGFLASRFDNYSYLFAEPFFINLDENATPPAVPLEGMRIGINGKEAGAGQAWSTLQTSIGGSGYDPAGQPISRLGTIIALDQGQSEDEFFLTFDLLGDEQGVETGPVTVPPDTLQPVSEQPRIGLRTFDEINAGMSALTGVPRTRVSETYNRIRQQLPSKEELGGFVTSHQVGVAQLAIEYCNALVEAEIDNDPVIPVFFSGLDYNTNADSISDGDWRTLVVQPLVRRMVTTGEGPGEDNQPAPATVEAELENLLLDPNDNKPIGEPNGIPDGLARCGGSCPSDQTAVATKAACAAALGSATLLLQ
jgi:hypothetical protein